MKYGSDIPIIRRLPKTCVDSEMNFSSRALIYALFRVCSVTADSSEFTTSNFLTHKRYVFYVFIIDSDLSL